VGNAVALEKLYQNTRVLSVASGEQNSNDRIVSRMATGRRT
jgi:hypothetical protein